MNQVIKNNQHNNMNKKELNQKLNDLEAEASKLRSLINEPDAPRTPEAGDMWKLGHCHWLVLKDDRIRLIELTGPSVNGWKVGDETSDLNYTTRCTDGDMPTYLGKFSEVYVRRDGHVSIADVRDALSHSDEMGDSVLSRPSSDVVVDLQSIYVMPQGAIKTREALRKLGIITK